jgi:hypothetical protein
VELSSCSGTGWPQIELSCKLSDLQVAGDRLFRLVQHPVAIIAHAHGSTMAYTILKPSSPATSPDVSDSPSVEKSTDRCDSPGAKNLVVIPLATDKPTFFTRNTTSTHGYHPFSLEFEAANCVTGAANGSCSGTTLLVFHARDTSSRSRPARNSLLALPVWIQRKQVLLSAHFF